MKRFKEDWRYYKNKLTYILIGIALVLGVHGLYNYYSPIISKSWQLFSAIFYGTMQLFLFSPPLGAAAEDVPLTYEIAKWLAPIMTSALVLTKVTNLFLNVKNKFSNYFSKDISLVFNVNDESAILINSLVKDMGKSVNVISTQSIDQNVQNQLEKLGAPTYIGDFTSMSRRERQEFLNNIRFERAENIFITGKEDYDNYTLVLHLLKSIGSNCNKSFFVEMSSSDLMEFIQNHLDKMKDNDESYRKVQISFYNIAELTVRGMLKEPLGKDGVLNKVITSSEPPHFVISGINELTGPTLLQLINLATVKIDEKIKITFLDEKPKDKMRGFMSAHEQLFLGMEFFYLEYSELSSLKDVHYYFLLHEDPLVNLELLSKLTRYESSVAMAFRNIGSRDLENLLKHEYEEILFFGNAEDIVNSEVLIQEELDKKAKAFNSSYGSASEIAGMGSATPWSDLSPVKKYSSRASAAHGEVKLALVKEHHPNLKDEALKKYLESENKKLGEMQKLYDDSGDTFAAEFRKYLDENPLMDYMAELEHLRWCRSYYALGFSLGESKDEFTKTHPCLIEDWNIVKGEKFLLCHPEYDLLAFFALKEVL